MMTHTRLAPVLARLRLTYQTAQALWAIDPEESAPPMKAVAQRLYCNASNLSFLAKQLEDRGYAQRQRDESDGRSWVLQLTAQGRAARQAVIEEALAVTPLTELSTAETRTLADLLTRAADRQQAH